MGERHRVVRRVTQGRSRLPYVEDYRILACNSLIGELSQFFVNWPTETVRHRETGNMCQITGEGGTQRTFTHTNRSRSERLQINSTTRYHFRIQNAAIRLGASILEPFQKRFFSLQLNIYSGTETCHGTTPPPSATYR